MLLTRLEVSGFKSFAQRTEFVFERGITALVGPNGCGKSNIVDAVRWVLGEQRPTAVRGNQMTDVIFNGSASRRPVGFAEVTITFLNDKGILPSEYTEVCVTRRLYRSGESEYLLNRQPCRLRDIRRLFLDTGVGVDTYGIIEQGKVDRFIQASPTERRFVFEEATGISRYKAQRKEAQARLERTRINLEKVEVQLDEQRRHLRSIRYQAAKARRYREYVARLRDLAVSLAVCTYREWEARRQEVERRIAGLEEQSAGLDRRLAQVEAHLRDHRERAGHLDRHRGDLRDRLHHVLRRLDACRARVAHQEEHIREAQQESERTTRAVWSLTEKQRQAREQLASAERDLEAVRSNIQRHARLIADESRKADAAAAECSRLSAAIEDWKNRMIQVIERATTLRNDLNHLEATRRQQISRRSRLLAQLAEKTAQAQALEEQARALGGQREALTSRTDQVASALRRKEEELRRTRDESEALQARLRELRRRETRCLSRREVLQDIETRAEDVGGGVKKLLSRSGQEAGGPRVEGMVADLVRAELPFAAAVEAALGDAAQYVITVSEDEAGAAVALLRTDRSGRAGLIPLSRAQAPECDGLHLASQPGVLGRACDLVRYRPDLEPVVRHLLGNTWVVDDLTTALHLSQNGGAQMRFVTLQGERVEPSGAIVGGEPLPRLGIVSRKSELEAVEAELSGLAHDIRRLTQEADRLAQRMGTLSGEAEAHRKELQQAHLDRLSNENELLALRRTQALLAQESEVIRSEVAEIDELLSGYHDRRRALEEELARTMARREEVQSGVESVRRRLLDQQSVAARLREEVTRLKVDLAEKQTRCGGLEGIIVSSRQTLVEVEAEIARARERLDELSQRQAAAEQDIRQARAELARLQEEQASLESDIRRTESERRDLEEAHLQEEQELRALRAERDGLSRALQEARLEEQEQRVRLEGLAERLFSEHGVRLEEAVAQASGISEDFDRQAAQQEVEQLRDKLRRMGGVNEEAIEEETGLEAAIAQAEAQRDDLLQAQEHLRGLIRKLNRISRERFTRTFEEVRGHFKETFRRLFGGGRADLLLREDEPDVLEAGIEVMACPPGKELRSITLLSGGEKTLTTIALLFAILRTRPTPFCILDEVDAALDESNIERFLGLLQDFVRDCQFIIITHSRRTIAMADVLYGITMQEKGVSQKVAVRVEQAVGAGA